MARFTVIGFTEAELGFVLAALFAALAGARIAESKAIKNQAYADSAALERNRRLIDSLKAELAKRPPKLDAKTSTWTPECWEKGESRTPIGTVMVIGASSYVIDGDTVDVRGVLSSFQAHIEKSRMLGCRYRLTVTTTDQISPRIDRAGTNRLREWFYVTAR